jgi:hypothetical protein
VSEGERSLDIISKNFFRPDERYGFIHELIHDLFTGKKLASNVLVSFCAKFKNKIVFNETTSNYNYANYVSSMNNRNERILFKFYVFI